MLFLTGCEGREEAKAKAGGAMCLYIYFERVMNDFVCERERELEICYYNIVYIKILYL